MAQPKPNKEYSRAQFEAAAKSLNKGIVFANMRVRDRHIMIEAKGTYQVGNITVKAIWNSQGQCRHQGNRRPLYDLFE